MAFKRSAVRSRLSPPKPDFFGNQVFFFIPRVFQANKQQRFDPAYLLQTPTERLVFFFCPERLSGIKTITGPAESYHVIARRAKPDVAIRIPCGAKHRPFPCGGRKENGLPRRFAPRNDRGRRWWSCCYFCGGHRGIFTAPLGQRAILESPLRSTIL